jgi:hypothetical protein
MKIALCFIISYNHNLNKEAIWRKWIEPNKDIINVYFYYKDLKKITSPWILQHVVDPTHIHETSYLHVIPAYLSVLSYARKACFQNQWFCILTENCCPIISPQKFRWLFQEYHASSIMNWRNAWWNIHLQKRANLFLIPVTLHLANDPYFILTRHDVNICFQFTHKKFSLFKTVCDGGLANESLFAIIFYSYKCLNLVMKKVTHLTDWSRMASPTSPYLFEFGTEKDKQFIEKGLKEHNMAMFLRKVSPDFPDEILNEYIYNFTDNNPPKSYKKELFSLIFFVFLIFTYALFCFLYK